MKQIICDMNLFDYEHKIMVLDMDTKESKLITKTTNVGIDIAKSCQLAETYSVHLYGNDNFINNFVVPVIEEYLSTTYGFDELEIEVN